MKDSITGNTVCYCANGFFNMLTKRLNGFIRQIIYRYRNYIKNILFKSLENLVLKFWEKNLQFTKITIFMMNAIGMKAYMYTICQCSLKEDTPKMISRYLYVVMRAYFICVFNTVDEGRIICREKNLKRIDSNHYSI